MRLADALVAELQKLGKSVSTIADQYKTQKPTDTAPPVVVAKLDPPSADNSKPDAYHQNQQWRDRARLAVEVLGLIFIVLVVGLTSAQYKATNEALKAARRANEIAEQQNHVDQRAWLTPDGPLVVTGLDFRHGQGTYAFNVRNAGKTPALKFSVPLMIFADPNGIPTSQAAACDMRIYEQQPQQRWGGILGPNATYREVIEIHLPKDSKLGINLPEPSAVFVAGCISYQDIFGHKHWTKFCFYTRSPNVQNQEFSPCEQHNYTDEIKDP